MDFRNGRLIACLLAAGLIGRPALAQEDARRFAIAAAPASAALPEFARQAGIDVLAHGKLLQGVHTRALEGDYSPMAALARLLEGSGLAARRIPSGTVLIEAAPRLALPEMAQVLVVGTRASEESSLRRKKQAATALDAIVADDVASFPDNNVAEAVSRIAGVALERGEFGEGNYVSVRGSGPEMVRVEMDGMAVLAGGGTDLNGGGEGRGVELRELPADLIAGVDVVKGSSADMTEGGIGGSILIRTRTGLDFKQRSFSVRTAAQINSINRVWTPNLNLFFADRLLGGRLGVVANLTRSTARNEAHQMQVGANNSGYLRDLDLDGSPEKTFPLNPAALSTVDPLVHQPLASFPAGGAAFHTLSPAQIVQRSASAQTKQACFEAFPWYRDAELAPLAPADRAAAQNSRAGELRSCLNQWNDYLPGITRYFVKTQVDRRINADLRVDFRIDRQLTVHAKINRTRRHLDDTINALSLGSPTTSNIGVSDQGAFPDIATRTVNSPGLSIFPGNIVNRGIIDGRFLGLTDGVATNIVPGSVRVDDSHHVVALSTTGASVNNDVIATTIGTTATTAQLGASWREGGLQADMLLGRTAADFFRYGLRSNLNFGYGTTSMKATPDGLWAYEFAGDNPIGQMRNLERYGVVGPGADQRQPLRGPLTQLTFDNPKASMAKETSAKLDLSYVPDAGLPGIERLKLGLNRRAYSNTSWGIGGYTAVSAGAAGAAVVVPTVAVRSVLQACEDSPGSLAPGGAPCQYGAVYTANPAQRFNGTISMTQQDYRQLVGATLAGQSAPFFRGAPRAPAGVAGWTTFDAAEVFRLSRVQFMNLDCIRSCTASNGVRYEQPRAEVDERITAGYASTEFRVDSMPFSRSPLPFGMEISGNVGWRYVRTTVAGTGLMSFQSVRKLPSWEVDGVTSTVMLTQNTTLARRTTDFMPVLNIAAGVLDDSLVLRYHRAKAIARPGIAYLIASGVTCTDDETRPEDIPCNGTLGNPGLPAHTSRNQNLSLEWYPDKQSLLSVSLFRQTGVLGAPRRVLVENQRPFHGAGIADPVTGRLLDDTPFTYVTWAAGLPSTRTGFELSAKTAFGRLPWYFRHTGASVNLWNVRWNNRMPIRELATALELPPLGEIRYSWATSLWYDDGALSLRAALQVNSWSFSRFQNLGPSFPAAGWSGALALPFLPSTPQIRDARRFVDARIGYKFKNGIEVFAEGRNLGKTSVSNSNGDFAQFDGQRALIDMSYSGARYMIGMVIRQR